MKPVILTDIDGVCLSWQSGLPYFAQKYNLPLEHILKMIQDEKFVTPGKLFNCDEELGAQLIEKYNCSDFIRYLSPYADALRVINNLKEQYDFVAVTALGDSIDARLNRQFNLNALFPGAFKEVMMCGHTASKEELFQKAKTKYNVVCYIDDLAHHCDHASEILEVPVYWMARGERDAIPKTASKVFNWDDVAGQLKLKHKDEPVKPEYTPDELRKLDELFRETRRLQQQMQQGWQPGQPWTPGYNPAYPYQYGQRVGTGIEYWYNQPTGGQGGN